MHGASIIVSFWETDSKIQTNAYVVYNTSDNDIYSEEKAEVEEIGNLTAAMVNRGHLNRHLRAGRGKHDNGCCKFSSVAQLCLNLCDPWTTACQASLSITNSQSLLKLMSIESVMPSNHLILCHPLLLPPSIFPRIRVFSNESALRIRQPKYWSLSLSISPSNEYSRLFSFWMD